MVALFVSVVVVLAVVIGYAFYRQGEQNRLAIESMVKMASAVGDALKYSEETNGRMVSSMALLKGIDPHHADPGEFAPTGVSWRTLEKVQKAQSLDEIPALQQRLFKLEQAREIWAGRGDFARAESYVPEIEALKKKLNGDENVA